MFTLPHNTISYLYTNPVGFITSHAQLHENGAALFWLFGWEEVRRRLDEFLSAFSETMEPPTRLP